MSFNKAKELTVNYSDVEVARISSTDLEENERSKGQKIEMDPRYTATGVVNNKRAEGMENQIYQTKFNFTQITVILMRLRSSQVDKQIYQIS